MFRCMTAGVFRGNASTELRVSKPIVWETSRRLSLLIAWMTASIDPASIIVAATEGLDRKKGMSSLARELKLSEDMSLLCRRLAVIDGIAPASIRASTIEVEETVSRSLTNVAEEFWGFIEANRYALRRSERTLCSLTYTIWSSEEWFVRAYTIRDSAPPARKVEKRMSLKVLTNHLEASYSTRQNDCSPRASCYALRGIQGEHSAGSSVVA